MASAVARTDELRTKRSIARAYFSRRSPQVITVALVGVLAARVIVGGWSPADVVVVVVTLAAVGPVEWFIHLYLLHADEDAWTSRNLGTGAGHREHHLDPPAIDWLLLRGVDAAVFLVLITIGTAAWSIPAAAIVGSVVSGGGLVAPFLTALAAAVVALGHYEWTHLMVHTPYRPRLAYYRRLARNHRRHHYRNERYWLGVTSYLGVRVMGTCPADRSDVPLSETCRTLT